MTAVSSTLYGVEAKGTPRRKTSLPVVFIAPAMVAVFLVSIYPVFDALILSLYKTKYAEKLYFVGAQNYLDLWNDPAIWQSGLNSLVYTAASLALVWFSPSSAALL